MTTRRIALIGILTAVALILALIENALPPILPVLPYARIGISQIAILFTLIIMGSRDSFIVLIIRTVLAALFSGNPSMMLYSIPSGIISLLVMILLLRLKLFSVPAVSVAGAAVHNLIQVAVAAIITRSMAVFVYLPYLMCFGAIAGLFTGILCYLLARKLPDNLYKGYL